MRSLLLILFCFILRGEEPLVFVQLSDPQLGMYAKDANTLEEEANLGFVVATVNRLKPAFVVVCGDLVNKGGDAQQIRSYQQLVKGIDSTIPVYNVAGNHDVGNEPTPEKLAQYRKSFGKDYYTFDAGGIRGIVLDSSLIQFPQNAPEEAAAQEKWLVDQLQSARRSAVKHLFVFQHISYFLQSADEPDQYFNIPIATRRRYLALFHQYGVNAIFCGHYHRNAYGRDAEIEMITTGPVGMPLGRDQSGIRAVRVWDGGMEHHYYELGAIPNRIDTASPLPPPPGKR
jgi:serine/threonine-protein phosphatase CPPED1